MSDAQPKRSRHLVLSSVACVLLGLGASLMLTIYGVIRWDTVWPDIVFLVGLALGLIVGLLPASARSSPPSHQGPLASPDVSSEVAPPPPSPA